MGIPGWRNGRLASGSIVLNTNEDNAVCFFNYNILKIIIKIGASNKFKQKMY